MIGLLLTPLPSSALVSLRPPSVHSLRYLDLVKPFLHPFKPRRSKPFNHKEGVCKAEFSLDAPIAAAIGGCVLASLLLPVTVTTNQEEEEEDDDDDDNESGSVMDSVDTRLAVMGIISVIPYFNWLSWVFAWIDTGKRRYAIYAAAYLIPYLGHNLSLSPEESWLPIASIIICIIHVQLETSIKNGDLESFQVFNDVVKHLPSAFRKADSQHTEHSKMRKRGKSNLPTYDDELRKEIRELKAKRRQELHGEIKGDWDELDDNGEEKRRH